MGSQGHQGSAPSDPFHHHDKTILRAWHRFLEETKDVPKAMCLAPALGLLFGELLAELPEDVRETVVRQMNSRLLR